MFKLSTLIFLTTMITTINVPDLSGRWQATKAVLSGSAFPEAVTKTLLLKMENGKYDLQNDHGLVNVLDDRRMEVTGTDGPNKGKTYKAIYHLDGDSLIICYDLSGESFPADFETKPGTKLFLVNYSREKN